MSRFQFTLAVVVATGVWAWAYHEIRGQAAVRPTGDVTSDPLVSDTMRSDAWLTDVCFVDAESGWAVGDRGAIWHTEDGGQQWRLQASPASCRLDSVCFINRRQGWVAGGHAQPLGEGSQGVLLWTNDGGITWQGAPKLLLPALRKVVFFNERHGWALGNASAMFPSGLFFTDSGGRGWQPLPAGAARGWLTGALLDPTTGALAGRMGALVTLQQGSFEPSQTVPLGLRAVHELTLVPPLYGWIVGDGGLLMLTTDLGRTWQTPPTTPPLELLRHFDFRALAVRGPKCWLAGSPGSRIFHSPDAGRTWQVFPTGQPLPLDGLCMVDEQHGWAVGALGTILATTDGGQSWQRQRVGGARAALLGLFAEPQDVPLELYARLSGNEGYLGVAVAVARRDVETRPRQSADLPERYHEAVVAVGGSGGEAAWQFPLRQKGLGSTAEQVIGVWDQTNDGRGMQNLQAHLVRQIRQWRPEVVLVGSADVHGDQVGGLLRRCVVQAVLEAADPTCFSEQVSLAGLEPWGAKKLFAVLPPGASGSVEVSPGDLAAGLGRTLYEVAAAPRALLAPHSGTSLSTLGFQLLSTTLPERPGRADFFTGIAVQPGGDARRQQLAPRAENLESFKRMAQHRKNVQAVFQQTQRDDTSLNLLAQTEESIRQFDPDSAAWLICQLAQRYRRNGQWELAAEAYNLLVERYSSHYLAQPALVWLVQYYSSSEAEWRVHGKSRYRTGKGSTPAVDTSRVEDRSRRAMDYASRLEQLQPAAFAEPSLRFPLAAAHRHQGLPRQAERFYQGLSRGLNRDAWWACADTERWLGEPKGVPVKPVLTCTATPGKPHLDGLLDDLVWRQARPARLQSPHQDDERWPATVMLAYDREFLYVAVSCRQAPHTKYDPPVGTRPRDPDLSGHDRVDILLDLDRDYVTCYRLTMDHRGWVADACWDDATWNPRWFVAAATTEGTWTAEAAIPLDQITGHYPVARDAWAIGIQRSVPSVGFQSWSQPAAIEIVPEGFGILIFE